MASENGHVTITRLEIRNFQRVRAGVWDLTAGLQRLTSGGKNKQGKTSVLRAIRTLFEGAGAIPPVPINTEADLSEDESFVRGWLSQGWTIQRTFTEKGSYLHVTGPDGALKSGQSILDAWTKRGERDRKNKAGFDPLTFFLLDAEHQAEVLLGLASDPDLKAKLDANAAREVELYNERTPHISEERRLRAVPKPGGERPEPVDVSAELKRMGTLQKAERERQDLVRETERKRDAARSGAREIGAAARREAEQAERVRVAAVEAAERATSEVERLQKELAAAEAAEKGAYAHAAEASEAAGKAAAALGELQEPEDAAAAIPDPELPPDPAEELEAVQARINEADAVNTALEPWKEWERAQAALKEASAAVAKLTEAVNEVRAERQLLIAGAEFPISGVDFTPEGTVTLNGLPIVQASGRERVELAVMAAVAANPLLRTILVDEGNDLDQEGLDHLAELAAAHGLQPIVARLGLEGAGELEVVDGWGPQPEEAEGAEPEAAEATS